MANDNAVQKLTADTYHQWKFEMKMLLIGKNLWELVEGTEVLHGFASAGEVMKFKKRQNHALSTICLSVSRELHIYVRTAKTAKEAWNNLSKRFEEKSITRKLQLRRRLYDAKLGSESMVTHVNNIKTIAEQLENLGDCQNEKDLVFILMSSLPMADYRNLITTLETLEEERLTWDYVRDRLLTEYERINHCEKVIKDDSPVQDAFYANPRNREQENNFIKKCHYCKSRE